MTGNEKVYTNGKDGLVVPPNAPPADAKPVTPEVYRNLTREMGMIDSWGLK